MVNATTTLRKTMDFLLYIRWFKKKNLQKIRSIPLEQMHELF